VRTPIHVVPHPFEPRAHANGEEIRAKHGFAPDDRIIGLFGFLTSAKRSEVVLEAFTKAQADMPNLRLLVVGGKNSAVESALRCYHAGAEVSISYRREQFNPKSIKYWLLPEINGLIADGKIAAFFNTVPVEITATSVVPPPMSTTMLPEGPSIGSPAPIAAAIGSSMMSTLRAPASFAASRTARSSTLVISAGTQIVTEGFGLKNVSKIERLRVTFVMK